MIDDMRISIDLSESVKVKAIGKAVCVAELCTQLCWLGSTLRHSPYDKLCIVRPEISLQRGISPNTPPIVNAPGIYTSEEDKSKLRDITIAVQFQSRPFKAGESGPSLPDGICWHAMFHNQTLVDQYPILARNNNEKGLETSFPMMTAVAQTDVATEYNGTLVLKGVRSMLVPTSCIESSVVWHYMSSGKTRMSYFDFKKQCATTVSTEELGLGRIDSKELRHFVGWASNITTHLGKRQLGNDLTNIY